MFDITSIHQATSVADAIAALTSDPKATVIAGGTDVLIKTREGKLAGCHLVSIHNLKEELSGVRLDDQGNLHIGPLTTFRHVTFDPLIRQHVPVLGEATDTAGGPQLRAVGTIGGNICNGMTSADSASTLTALDVTLEVTGAQGKRYLPISQWYKGVGKVDLAQHELLTDIILPQSHYQGWSGHYIKYAQRNAMDIATLGVSCLVKLSEDKQTVENCRLAFGVAGPVPMRAANAETGVKGLSLTDAFQQIGDLALTDVNPRDSWRASKAFRIQLVGELSGRAFAEAVKQGGGVL